MTRPLRKLTATVTLAAALTLTSACEESPNQRIEQKRPTIAIQQANRLVNEYMDQARNALSSEAQLTDDFRKEHMACDDPSDGEPKGRVFATRDSQVVGMTGRTPEENFELLRTWWTKNGFRVTEDDGNRIYAENKENGFRMSLEANSEDFLYLGVSSPCVWPNGTPTRQE